MKDKEIYRRYSEAFKRQVVTEYEQGASMSALRRKYRIGSDGTVATWVKQYAREGVRHETIHIQSAAEAQQVQQLVKERALLQQIIADLTVKNVLLEGQLQVYQETYGAAVLKKNVNGCSKPRTPLEEEA